MLRMLRTTMLLLLFATAVTGCGDDDNDLGVPVPDGFDPAELTDPAKCGGATETSATIDVSQVDNLQYGDPISGEFTISLTKTEDLPDSFEDPFSGGEIVKAQGRFVGFRYTITNDATTKFQPGQIAGHLRLTDGDRSWEEADYTGGHTDVSSSWAQTKGDEQTATMVGAGFDLTTWVVFDIPKDAKPTGLSLALIGDQQCLGLP